MKTLQGPAIFLAQYAAPEAPFDTIESISAWASGLGFKGVQLPTWEKSLIDLDIAAESKDYCDELKGKMAANGVVPTELSTHLQGQLVAVHPAYDDALDCFAAESVRGNPAARTEWAIGEVKKCLSASANLGLSAMATFPGSLLWPFVYPWPPRPAGLVDAAWAELVKRWMPILDHAKDVGVDCAFELHPSEDLHDGATFEHFLELTGDHDAVNILYDPSHFVLQGLDYLQFIDLYHERIKAFHVKDAELRCDGRVGVYGGYQAWNDRAGRFRSLGDGTVDFKQIFTKLANYDFDGWAVLEWECAYKDNQVGAAEGAKYIAEHIIPVTETSFDDFASGGADDATNRRILGIDR